MDERTFIARDARAIIFEFDPDTGLPPPGNGRAILYRKIARILAIRMDTPFEVETEHGIIGGEAGDYLATNHPADDPGSDMWPISAIRMEATYEPVDPDV